MTGRLEQSRALWNRSRLDLASDEVLAQLLDRGEPEAWRELYAFAAADAGLRLRILHIVDHVPLPLPRFWRAAMASLGERVDFDAPVPPYGDAGT
jgi:hypothetical protein